VTIIGEGAFVGCNGLENITVSKKNNAYIDINGVLFNKDCTELLSFPGGRKGEYIISDSVIKIDDYAFSDCEGLTNITIPDSVTKIGEGAFEACRGLTSIKIPNNVTWIWDLTFQCCSGLTSITIPDGVIDIGMDAFYNCSGLTSIIIPNSVTHIDIEAFSGCIGLTSITIPDSVTYIDQEVFSGCIGLTSITIPNSVTKIWLDAFNGCIGLSKVYYKGNEDDWNNIKIESGNSELTDAEIIYNSVMPTPSTKPTPISTPTQSPMPTPSTKPTPISTPTQSPSSKPTPNPLATSGKCGDNVTWSLSDDYVLTISGTGDMWDWNERSDIPWYNNNNNITSVVIENGITSIGDHAFYECEQLTSITIPDGVTDIGEDAFNNCKKLESINFPNSISYVGEGAFEHCYELHNVYISNMKSWTKIKFDIPDSYHPTYANQSAEAQPLHNPGNLYVNNKLVKDLIIPSGITSISNGAFKGCDSLTSVTIPNGVTSIGCMAFYWCTNLESVVIPKSVTFIGSYTFRGCKNLKTIYYEGSQFDWSNIEINKMYHDDINFNDINIVYNYNAPTPEPLINLLTAEKSTSADGSSTVSITLAKSYDGQLIAVQYDTDGKLISVSTKKTVSENNKYTLEISDADRPVKIMYFDGLSNIKPVSLAAEIK